MLSPSKSSTGLVSPLMTPVSSPFLGFTSSSSSANSASAAIKNREDGDGSCQEYRDWELPSRDSAIASFDGNHDGDGGIKRHGNDRGNGIHSYKMMSLPPSPPSIAPLPPTPPATPSKSTTCSRTTTTTTGPMSPSATSTRISANRFTDAQRDRTLRHHKLVQPTPIQERAHLLRLYSTSSSSSSPSSPSSSTSLPQLQLDPHPLQHRSMIEYPRNVSSSCLSLLTLPEQDLREEGELEVELEDEAEQDIRIRTDDDLGSTATTWTAHSAEEDEASHAGSSAVCETLEITYENQAHERNPLPPLRLLPFHPPLVPVPRRSSSASSWSWSSSSVSSSPGTMPSLERDFRRMSTTSAFSEDGLSEFLPTTSTFVPGESSSTRTSLRMADTGKTNMTFGSDASTAASTVESDVSTATASFAFMEVCRPCNNEMETHSTSHRFVVCADTQFGITARNQHWDAEAEYSMAAVDLINSMAPRPSFVCVCGDLVDMEYSFEKTKGAKSQFAWYFDERKTGIASRDVCDSIQDEQNEDFKKVCWRVECHGISRLCRKIIIHRHTFSSTHILITTHSVLLFGVSYPFADMVRTPSRYCVGSKSWRCLCGNHDVGNRPTPRSISRFRAAFGDEYLAFWANGTYNIVLNNVLFVDHSRAKKMHATQLQWLEDRLRYAQDHEAKQVYVFAHHPWFLYDEDEDPETLTGASPYPDEWRTGVVAAEEDVADATFPDSYFSMPKRYRVQALELFRKYRVDACFSGHFHQNLISRTSWGCDMIVTAPLSVVFESTGKTQRKRKAVDGTKDRALGAAEDDDDDDDDDGTALGGRRRRKMTYESEEAMMSDGSSDDGANGRGIYMGEDDGPEERPVRELNCRGVRVVDVHVHETAETSGFSHWFVPL
ncbi:hypothetical protein ACHAXS_014348 [Conticribra weissflogii]